MAGHGTQCYSRSAVRAVNRVIASQDDGVPGGGNRLQQLMKEAPRGVRRELLRNLMLGVSA